MDSRELVDPAQVGKALAVLSVLALVLAAVLSYLARRRRSAQWARGALLAAAAAPAYPLWVVYNRIEDHFGLDSVAALLLNLGLFAALGIAAGLALRGLDRKFTAETQRTQREKEPQIDADSKT